MTDDLDAIQNTLERYEQHINSLYHKVQDVNYHIARMDQVILAQKTLLEKAKYQSLKEDEEALEQSVLVRSLRAELNQRDEIIKHLMMSSSSSSSPPKHTSVLSPPSIKDAHMQHKNNYYYALVTLENGQSVQINLCGDIPCDVAKKEVIRAVVTKLSLMVRAEHAALLWQSESLGDYFVTGAEPLRSLLHEPPRHVHLKL
eukprot:PhF_6_TR5751/c0_g1_i1/m.8478